MSSSSTAATSSSLPSPSTTPVFPCSSPSYLISFKSYRNSTSCSSSAATSSSPSSPAPDIALSHETIHVCAAIPLRSTDPAARVPAAAAATHACGS